MAKIKWWLFPRRYLHNKVLKPFTNYFKKMKGLFQGECAKGKKAIALKQILGERF